MNALRVIWPPLRKAAFFAFLRISFSKVSSSIAKFHLFSLERLEVDCLPGLPAGRKKPV